ncbi:hypothetical protein ACEWY4_007978 [Coilia grayii]|uniref:Ig-like domain-containing protein n=1 Tax=Coilia grayii TaxID=363190 RepID=A0ABD1K9K3_9TELE
MEKCTTTFHHLSPVNLSAVALCYRCYVDDRVSRVAWLNRSNIIFAGRDKWSLDPRVELVTKGQLEYSLRIQKVDVYDEGQFTCSIQTKELSRTSQLFLIVQVPANIYKVSEDITINEGSNVTLTCLASGRPDPMITWRLLNPSAEPLYGEEYLDISGITRTQAGRYECKASNDVASPDVKYVNVIVNYAPFIKDTKSSDPQVGRMGVLQCEASAIPKPEFKWYRDDKRSRCEAVMGARYVALCSYSAPVSQAACLYELLLSPIFTSTCWRLAPGLSAGDWHQVFLLETGTRSFCWRLAPGLSAGDWHQVFLLETGTRSFCRRLAPGLSAGDWHQVFLLEIGTRLSNGQGISIQMMGSRTLLLVSNVTEEDYGNYTCVATNRLGIHNASVFLYRPGTANNMSGAVAVSQSLWLLLGSLTCLLLKC